jgi:hypothetical protein
MDKSNIRTNGLWVLPYAKSAPITITVDKAAANRSGSIKLQAPREARGKGVGSSPGFVFALYPLQLSSPSRIANTTNTNAQKGFDATDITIGTREIDIVYANTINDVPLKFMLYLWWSSDVTEIGMEASGVLHGEVNFASETKNLDAGNQIYFYTP